MSNPIKAYLKSLAEHALQTRRIPEDQLNRLCQTLAERHELAKRETDLIKDIQNIWPFVQSGNLPPQQPQVSAQHAQPSHGHGTDEGGGTPARNEDGHGSDEGGGIPAQDQAAADHSTEEETQEPHSDTTPSGISEDESTHPTSPDVEVAPFETNTSQEDEGTTELDSEEAAETSQEPEHFDIEDLDPIAREAYEKAHGISQNDTTEEDEAPASPAGEALEVLDAEKEQAAAPLEIEGVPTAFTNTDDISPAVSMDPANANRALNEHDLRVQEELAQPIQQQQMNQTRFNLTNAKVGRPYQFEFDLDAHQLNDIVEYHIEGLEELGLRFDPDENMIEGTPTEAGDHELTLYYKIAGVTEDQAHLTKTIPLIINPDPRSLWKDLPPPEDAPYPKANNDAEVSFAGTKAMVAASKRGRSHAHGGTFRDDDFGIDYHANSGWYVLSVADGAGSAQFSREGSKITCDTILNDLKALDSSFDNAALEQHLTAYINNPNEDTSHPIVKQMYETLGTAALNAYKAIEAEAHKTGAVIKDYGTTLLAACCRKIDAGWFVASLWIGDGAIAIYTKGGAPILLGSPDGGEFAGQTRFLTMPDTFEDLYTRIKFDIVENFTALMLMTDGVSDPMFQTDFNLEQQEHWDNLWNEMSENVKFDPGNEACGTELLEWLDFWSPGNHDDRTIAILF